MKKLNIILLAILGVLALTSCEDFLDMRPSNQGDSSEAITTAVDAEFMLYGIYGKLTSSSYYGRNFIVYGDAKGGDLTIYTAGRGLDYLYSFNHSPSSGSGSGYWSQGYNIIANINNLLEKIALIEAKPDNFEDFSSAKGQAHTLRALVYFDLVRLYGKSYTQGNPSTDWGVPNITTMLEHNAQPKRATVAQNYAQILSDLQEGAKGISKSVGTATNGYINYWANKAIEARVHLTMGKYNLALSAAEEIIESGKYKLYDNEEWVTSWSEEFGSESIFELSMLIDEGDLGNSSLGAYYSRRKHMNSSCMGWFGASDYFIARLAEDKDDVRHGIMDFDEESDDMKNNFYTGKGFVRRGSCYKYLGAIDTVNTGLGRSRDYTSKGVLDRNAYGKFPGDGKGKATAVNIKVIRLSEIYLIAAEAALQSDQPDPAKAAEYLNAIRKRSPNLAPADASTVTLDMILDEKSKEFFGEGLRYWDMLRLGKTIEYNDEINGAGIAHRDKIIDTKTFHKCILPIDQDEINANPGIGEQQNPGY